MTKFELCHSRDQAHFVLAHIIATAFRALIDARRSLSRLNPASKNYVGVACMLEGQRTQAIRDHSSALYLLNIWLPEEDRREVRKKAAHFLRNERQVLRRVYPRQDIASNNTQPVALAA